LTCFGQQSDPEATTDAGDAATIPLTAGSMAIEKATATAKIFLKIFMGACDPEKYRPGWGSVRARFDES